MPAFSLTRCSERRISVAAARRYCEPLLRVAAATRCFEQLLQAAAAGLCCQPLMPAAAANRGVLRPLMFLAYLNDIWRNTESTIRLFEDGGMEKMMDREKEAS